MPAINKRATLGVCFPEAIAGVRDRSSLRAPVGRSAQMLGDFERSGRPSAHEGN